MEKKYQNDYKQQFKKILKKIETTLDLYFAKKAPQLPENIKDLIVKIAPWIILISLIISLPSIMMLLGLNTAFIPINVFTRMHTGAFLLPTISMVTGLILNLIALPGLFKKEKRSWNLIYYATLISITLNIFSTTLFGTLISGIISFYIIFQIRDKYTN